MHCAVLGDPIAHSLSPVLHRAAYRELGLDWTYDAVRVPAGGLEAFLHDVVRHARERGWRGLSLTMPLKREVLELVLDRSPAVRRAGAANTVVIAEDGRTRLENTDLPGAAAAVRERYEGPVTGATILGAGATAASVGLALADLGARRLRLLARSPERAAETVGVLAAHPAAPDVEVLGLDESGVTGEVAVSTVPATAQTAALAASLAQAPVVFEVLYDPWPTPVATAAERAGRVLVTGLDLLSHQAVGQIALFTGQTVAVDVVRRAGAAALADRAERTERTGA